MLTFYLTTLGIVPLFVSRAFLPVFATALVARLGGEWGWLAQRAGFELLADLPPWLRGDAALALLGVLALVEVARAHVPELRELLPRSEARLKGIGAFFLCFLLVEGDPRDLLAHLLENGLSTDYAWGRSFAYTWSFGIGWLVYLGARLRSAIYAALIEADEDDSVGLQRLLAWAEDGVGFFGVLFAVLLPAVACGVAGLTLLGLGVLRRGLEARERRSRAPCSHCGAPSHLCALACASCREALPAPRQVGVLGTARSQPVEDPEAHAQRLLARHRCASCAERLTQRRADQRCPACGTPAFADVSALEAYLSSLRERLPRTLGVAAALGLVPVLGLVPGIVYYRINLIAGMRYYVPRSRALVSRWLVRGLNLVLLCLQPVPLLGALSLPIMCSTHYAVHRAALRGQRGRLPDAPVAWARPALDID